MIFNLKGRAVVCEDGSIFTLEISTNKRAYREVRRSTDPFPLVRALSNSGASKRDRYRLRINDRIVARSNS